MQYLIATAGLGLALLLSGLWLRQRPAARRRAAPTTTPAPTPVATPAPVTPTTWALPPALAAFRRRAAFDLDAGPLQVLSERLRRLPRPPQGLQTLVLSDRLERQDTAALAEHILAEPAVAAKVLASVNAPFYGLPRPVTNVAQAITVLGADAVRGICLQHLVNEGLRPTDARLQAVFDRWSDASAIATRLCLRLGPQAGLRDPGAAASLVVLSFLGHMVALSLLPVQDTLDNAAQGFLERCQREQDTLGLCAGELGCLLMEQWHMPATIVEDVRLIDHTLTTGPRALDPERGLCSALAYYCARVGEKLASGEWPDLHPAVPEALRGPEFYHLQTHFMVHTNLQRLAVALRDERLVAEVDTMVRHAAAAGPNQTPDGP